MVFFNNYFAKFFRLKDKECLQSRLRKNRPRRARLFPVLFSGAREKGIGCTDFGSPEARPAWRETQSRCQGIDLHFRAGPGVSPTDCRLIEVSRAGLFLNSAGASEEISGGPNGLVSLDEAPFAKARKFHRVSVSSTGRSCAKLRRSPRRTAQDH